MAMRNVRGLLTMAGFAASMGMLAVASLAAIPAMINASGPTAWGAIALGQGVGAIAAVVIAYGWGLSGPAIIAAGDVAQRRTEYLSSVRVKRLLLPLAAVVAAVLAAVISRDLWAYGMVGALAAASIGLTANWFFVGLGRPYVMLLVETTPRVVGTTVGIGFMTFGSSALVGVLCQLLGMVMAFTASTAWILHHTRSAVDARPTVRQVMVSQRHGLTSTVVSSAYVSAPLVIVSAIAPWAQPLYALADKVQRQISVALGPLVTVQQGWVPRATGEHRRHRARVVLAGGAALAALCGLTVALAGPYLLAWLGGDHLVVPRAVLLLVAGFVTLSVYESMVSKVVLAGLGEVARVSRATSIGALVGLPLVAIGALRFGAAGALVGVVVGLVLRLVLELVPAIRLVRRTAELSVPDAVVERAHA